MAFSSTQLGSRNGPVRCHTGFGGLVIYLSAGVDDTKDARSKHFPIKKIYIFRLSGNLNGDIKMPNNDMYPPQTSFIGWLPFSRIL